MFVGGLHVHLPAAVVEANIARVNIGCVIVTMRKMSPSYISAPFLSRRPVYCISSKS
jgi:hypothetical protein